MLIGLPCVTASAADIRSLMADVELHPKARLTVDLPTLTCRSDSMFCTVTMPPHVRDAFVTGAWDTTGLLRERYEEVNATAAKLPYVTRFS